MNGLHIVSTGRALPAHSVTNDELSRHMDTSDEWISSRTGIRSRYFCDGEHGHTLAAAAAREAMGRAGVGADEIGACIVATFSPDYTVPANACLVQAELGLPEDAPAFDMNAGCTGFLYALHTMRGLLMQSKRKYGLVIGAEVISKYLTYDDRSTAVLFGDGAGAVLVTLGEYLWDCQLGVRGNREILWADEHIHMDGSAVFRFASEMVPVCVSEILARNSLTLADLRWIVPHQANRRIIEHAAKRLGAPIDLFYQNMDHYGNTSAASVPLALDELASGGLLQPGDQFVCVAFGTGLTWGSALLEW
ncbi:MAG: beta-ketoacyl-ACP synthase 3 [Oscillospiraceae bacterium]|nr:beta-ketoacyl-ACP synthase 3 [Oscillospiraceae bacterium]